MTNQKPWTKYLWPIRKQIDFKWPIRSRELHTSVQSESRLSVRSSSPIWLSRRFKWSPNRSAKRNEKSAKLLTITIIQRIKSYLICFRLPLTVGNCGKRFSNCKRHHSNFYSFLRVLCKYAHQSVRGLQRAWALYCRKNKKRQQGDLNLNHSFTPLWLYLILLKSLF